MLKPALRMASLPHQSSGNLPHFPCTLIRTSHPTRRHSMPITITGRRLHQTRPSNWHSSKLCCPTPPTSSCRSTHSGFSRSFLLVRLTHSDLIRLCCTSSSQKRSRFSNRTSLFPKCLDRHLRSFRNLSPRRCHRLRSMPATFFSTSPACLYPSSREHDPSWTQGSGASTGHSTSFEQQSGSPGICTLSVDSSAACSSPAVFIACQASLSPPTAVPARYKPCRNPMRRLTIISTHIRPEMV